MIVDCEKCQGKGWKAMYCEDGEGKREFMANIKCTCVMGKVLVIPKDEQKYNMLLNDLGYNHLEWIYNRLIHVHGENDNYDYMIKLKEIVKLLKEE